MPKRPRPADLEAIDAIDQSLTAPPLIMVVDDVLTTGAHFKAASAIVGRDHNEPVSRHA